MISKPRVFLADDNPQSFDFYRALCESAEWTIAGYAVDFDSFINRAAQSDADVMLVSAGFLAVSDERERRSLRAGVPGRIILAITDSNDFHELKAAVRAGARDCVCAADSPEKITGLVYDYFFEADSVRNGIAGTREMAEEVEVSPGPGGRVTAFCGADGGTGKSFLALQAAGIAALHGGAKTCLVDFDLKCGALSGVIGSDAPGERSLADLGPVIDEIRPIHIENLLRGHKAGFSVICGPAPDITETPELFASVIEPLREMFDAIIIDFPPNPGPHFSPANIDSTFIVMTPDASSAGCARQMASGIWSLNENADVAGIVNRCDRHGAVKTSEIKRLSGLDIAAEVPDDEGAGQLYDKCGRVFAASTGLRIVREFVPAVQRIWDFHELVKPKGNTAFANWGLLWPAKQ